MLPFRCSTNSKSEKLVYALRNIKAIFPWAEKSLLRPSGGFAKVHETGQFGEGQEAIKPTEFATLKTLTILLKNIEFCKP